MYAQCFNYFVGDTYSLAIYHVVDYVVNLFDVCSILSCGVSIEPYDKNRRVIGSLIKVNGFNYLCLKENQLT